MRILREELTGSEPTAAAIAQDALERLGLLPARESSAGAAVPSGLATPGGTSIMVHGTWAQLRSSWWRPGGDLFEHVSAGLAPNLYAHLDYFRWDGRYRTKARNAAAVDLAQWVRRHRVDRLDMVYAHSHGGNVVLDALATTDVSVRLLVLSSTPARVRPRQEWQRILSRTGRIIHVHARFDLVVLADRSWQRFDPPVHDITLAEVWCHHQAVLRPGVWKEHRLDQEIAYASSMA